MLSLHSLQSPCHQNLIVVFVLPGEFGHHRRNFGGWKLEKCRYCHVSVGFLYSDVLNFPFLNFTVLSRKAMGESEILAVNLIVGFNELASVMKSSNSFLLLVQIRNIYEEVTFIIEVYI